MLLDLRLGHNISLKLSQNDFAHHIDDHFVTKATV